MAVAVAMMEVAVAAEATQTLRPIRLLYQGRQTSDSRRSQRSGVWFPRRKSCWHSTSSAHNRKRHAPPTEPQSLLLPSHRKRWAGPCAPVC